MKHLDVFAKRERHKKNVKLKLHKYRGFITILNRQAREVTWVCYFMEKVGRDVKDHQAKLCSQTDNLPGAWPLMKPMHK